MTVYWEATQTAKAEVNSAYEITAYNNMFLLQAYLITTVWNEYFCESRKAIKSYVFSASAIFPKGFPECLCVYLDRLVGFRESALWPSEENYYKSHHASLTRCGRQSQLCLIMFTMSIR